MILTGCSEFLAKGKLGKQARLLGECFCRPKDLSVPAINEPINLNEINSTHSFDFTLKYAGTHSVGFSLANFDTRYYLNRSDTNLNLKFCFYLNDQLILTKESTGKVYPFFGDTNGVGLVYIESPEEIPIDKIITCKVIILKTDEDFLNEYGPASFFVGRHSDL